MSKKIPTLVGILIILGFFIITLSSFFFSFREVVRIEDKFSLKEEKVEEEIEKEEEPKTAKETLEKFLHYAFIEKNYKRANDFYSKDNKEEIQVAVNSFSTTRKEDEDKVFSIKEIKVEEKEKIEDRETFLVEFLMDDGDLLSVTICCDEDSGDYIIHENHIFFVEKQEDGWRVENIIYQP